MASIEERVKQIVAEQLGVDDAQVTPEASFMDDLGADSLDTVELVMALEEEFDIEISDEDAEKIQTVQDAINYINETACSKRAGERRPLPCPVCCLPPTRPASRFELTPSRRFFTPCAELW